MAIYRDEVIIVKSRKIGEADKIFTLFARRRGKLGAIAKSIRKLTSRKRGHLETYNVCKVSCAEGKNLDVLLEAEAVITLDPDTLSTEEYENIGFAATVIDKMIPDGVTDQEVFDCWENVVKNRPTESDVVEFVITVLRNQGFMNEEQAKAFTRTKDRSLDKLKLYVQKVMDTI